MRRGDSNQGLSEINDLNQQTKDDRIKIIEKEASQIAESFYLLVKNLKIHKEGEEVDAQIAQSKIESLQSCVSAEQIVVSCNRLMTLVEELRSIIVLNDFGRLYKTYSVEKAEIFKKLEVAKEGIRFEDCIKRMLNRFPADEDEKEEEEG